MLQKISKYTLGILALASSLASPASAGDFAYDPQYNGMYNRTFTAPPVSTSSNLFGRAATGQQQGNQSFTTWQDASPIAPGLNQDAGLGRTFQGYSGNQKNQPLLPNMVTEQGLMAALGGHMGAACGSAGSGGFGGGGGSSIYPELPPTSTSLCNINVAE